MNLKRLLAFSLSMAMMISAMPALVLADEADSGSTETTITETTEPKENETEKAEEKKPEEAEDKTPAHPENEGEKTVESKSEDAEEEKQQTETAKQTAKNAAAQKIPGCNLTWYIDASTKTLVISGKGKMSKMNNDAPWFNHLDEFDKVVVKNGVTSIGDYAFRYYPNRCNNIISVSIPSSVKTIGFEAFVACSNLKTVKLSKGLTSIGFGAFKYCSNLESITIPEGVTTIDEEAFFNCNNLVSVKLPNSLRRIGKNAFASYNKIENFTIPYGVVSIDGSAFQRSNVTTVTIPSSVTSLGDKLFYNCSNLQQINITKELYEKYPNAFEGCPDTVKINNLDDNPMTVKGKTAKVKYRKLRKKKRTVSVSKYLKFTKRGQGTLIYRKVSGSKRITVANNGVVTVKKKTKRKTYKIKVKVLATGNDTYRDSGWKTVTFKIKVK